MTKFAKLLSLILCLTLATAVFAACGEDETQKAQGLWANAKYTEDTTLGDGAKAVTFKVEAGEKSITLTLKTDAATLGDALKEQHLIEGTDGLYTVVNGIRADYNEDGYYWGFFQNGEYMMQGIDDTEIKGGEQFELVRTKG